MVFPERRQQEMSNAEIIQRAMEQALVEANRNGLKVGDTVGFYSEKEGGDELSYELLEIDGDTAVIGYENEKDGKVRKEAKLKDLIDVNLVRAISSKILKEATRIFPPETLN